MLSDALATAAGSSPAGSGTSMWSAYGTRTSVGEEPAPVRARLPEPVHRERRHGAAVAGAAAAGRRRTRRTRPETARSRARRAALARTPSPISTTSATHSCPSAIGAGNGVSPAIIAQSRSHVATATGRTSASPSHWSAGAAASRTSSRVARPGERAHRSHSAGVLADREPVRDRVRVHVHRGAVRLEGELERARRRRPRGRPRTAPTSSCTRSISSLSPRNLITLAIRTPSVRAGSGAMLVDGTGAAGPRARGSSVGLAKPISGISGTTEVQ